MKKHILTDKNSRSIGRTFIHEDKLLLSLSGSGAEFVFTGSRLEVTFEGDGASRTADNVDNYARMAVFVDGTRAADTQIDSPEKTVTVFDSDTPRTAKVQIIKLSECAMSTAAIACVLTDDEAQLSPTQADMHRIEFIGDSITCGYGVDDEDPLHHFKTLTEDVTRAYAYKTAKMLGAQYSMFSTSGYGIISGFTENGERIPEQTIPQYYESYGFSYQKFAEKFYPQQTKWDFSRYVPQLIVINLGTNDDSYCQDDTSRQELYTREYVKFLGVVRKNNPDSYILCCVGIMGQRIFGALKKAVDTYVSESGDEKISAMLFDEQDSENDGLVADYHPTETTHEKAAAKLCDEIRKIMGW